MLENSAKLIFPIVRAALDYALHLIAMQDLITGQIDTTSSNMQFVFLMFLMHISNVSTTSLLRNLGNSYVHPLVLLSNKNHSYHVR